MNTDKIIDDVCSNYTQDLYAMYLRKSRADIELEAIGEGETLAKHKEMLYALAAKHDIHPDQIVIYQEIVSGESIQDRPQMQQLLNDVYLKKYKGVLVVEVERLARGNTKDQGEVADAFQYSNTHIITPSKVYDPNDEYDQEYFEFGLFMSRREYKTIRRRLLAGKYAAVKDGNYIGSRRLFGYNIERPSKKERILVPNPEEVPIVQMIFNWCTEDGRGNRWIASKLNAMGIKPTIAREWGRSTIRDMLQNVHYIGKVRWYRHEHAKEYNTETGLVDKKYRLSPDRTVIFEGKHEGIISEEQFAKAAEMTKRKSVAPTKQQFELANPFAGILKCCDCGKSLRWQCYPDNRVARIMHSTSLCKKKSVAYTAVEEAIVAALKAYIADFEIKIESNNDQSELIRHQEMIASMEKNLANLERKRKKLFDDYEDEVYTKEEFIERKQKYAVDIDTLKTKIKDAKESAPKPVNYEEQITNLHAMIDCVLDRDLSAKEKNVFLKKFIDRISFDSISLGNNKGATPVLEVFLK